MKPVKPDSSDCCRSGCTPCVFDVFEDELKKWERNKQCDEKNSELRNNLLSNLRYLPFEIMSIRSITPNVYLYRFQPFINCEKGNENCDTVQGELNYKPSQHFIMRCSQKITDFKDYLRLEQTEEIQNVDSEANNTSKNLYISRAFTPISLASEERNCCFDMIIKLYTNGTMSCLLRDLSAGDLVHFRGPYGGFVHRPKLYSSLTMICAGTGIAPMISIIKSIINDENDETLILLLFTVTSFQNIILRQDIQQFCRSWNMTAKIYLTNERSWDEICQHIRHNEIIINQRITELVIQSEVLCRKNNQILICGPDGFCEQVKRWLLLSGDNDIENKIFIF